MQATATSYAITDRGALSRLVRAGLLTGVVDGLFSSVLSVAFYHSTVPRLFQGIASAVLGPEALDRGTPAIMLGILLHFGVAFGWSAVFLLATRLRWVQNLLSSRYGMAKAAAAYGPFIWMVMSLVIIPFLTQRPPTIGARWWVQFFGHIPFVGLPIAATLGRTAVPNRHATTLP